MTPTEEPDTEIDRYQDASGLPLSREAERESLHNLTKHIGKKEFLYFLIEDRQGQVVGRINSSRSTHRAC